MKIKNTVKVYYYSERNPEIEKGAVLDKEGNKPSFLLL